MASQWLHRRRYLRPWSASLAGALTAVGLVALLGALPAAAQTPVSGVEVSWEPGRPVVGTLFVVRLRLTGAASARELTGSFGGEPLHFLRSERPAAESATSGTVSWAVAAVPIDAADSLALEVHVRWNDGRTRTITGAVPLAAGRYRMERLAVAPRFGAPLSPELRRRTEQERARAMQVARGAHGTPPLWTSGGFMRPRAARITSGFGNGREFNGQVQSRHMGTDIDGDIGDPVLAAAAGIVQLVDAFYLGGTVVYVDHGGGLSTGYLHLSETLVQQGDTVRAGQRIGSVGASGRVTGPHLHWIVRYGGVTVDPLSAVELEVP